MPQHPRRSARAPRYGARAFLQTFRTRLGTPTKIGLVSSNERRQLRVLQLLAHDDTGGTELMIAMLAPELRRQGVGVEVAFLQGHGPISERLLGDGVPVHPLGTRGVCASIPRLAVLLRGQRFDVINVYGIKASLLARGIARCVRQPAILVCGVQGLHVTETERFDSRKARVALWLERRLSPLIDLYESNSTGALEVLRSAGIEPSKLRYIPNGIDLAQWPMRSTPPRARVPMVLCTARFVPRKRQADIVRAAAIMRDRGVAVSLVFAGDGPTLAAVAELIVESELQSSVRLLGDVDAESLRNHFGDATAFCLVSTWEGMPAAVMEAMARGVPVVGSNVNGINDLVDDLVTGLLVPPCDPNAIADALTRLIADPNLCCDLAAAARARIEERHTLRIMAAEKLSLYSDVANAGQ